MIYTLTPNKRISSKSVNKGSLFTTVLWIVITFIYSFYVTNYASYNDYYGSASNILVLMLWIFIISEVFVIGMVINSIEDRKLNKE
jgi:membrane protein